ncbi:MAG: adenylate/guanylate cyclase domain-containing protein [Deltaproteobacteria bacterium]|nr:adenylate/guanylate cyclase domain-containing protein [Deltaproteobacteria bacterium]
MNMRRFLESVFLIFAVLALVPFASLAGVASSEHMKMVEGAGAAMDRPVASVPFYQEHTFLVLAGFATAVVGFVAFRIAKRRRGRKVEPAALVNEAALVVDLVNSTHVSTHYGNGLAMRARSALKDRTLAIAAARRLTFSENTGDGYFMTFASVGDAVHTAIELLNGLRDQPPDLSPGPPIAVRVGISYGEILLDSHGGRHGAAINKAFRLEGLTAKSFTRVEGESELGKLPDCNRIFIDEDASHELRSSGIPMRSVGFCRLKGFSGLHRVFEVLWHNDARPPRNHADSYVPLKSIIGVERATK